MFRASQRCRIPHVNIDNLRDMVFQARIVSRNEFTSSDELFQWFLSRNEMTSELTEDREWLNRGRRLARRGGSTWYSSAKRENFNQLTFSCFVFESAQTSFGSLTHNTRKPLENQRSNEIFNHDENSNTNARTQVLELCLKRH